MFLKVLDKQKKIINKKDSLIVGVSGGPDSMGLLHFLISIKDKYDLKINVAHVNHHTRDNENIYEENLIKSYCENQSIPIFIANFKYSNQHNFHEEARNFRLDFFLKLANKLNSNKIALAHHQDDQIETILFKILRGNHLSGYVGMKESFNINEEISLIRPLLDVTKQEILAYCKEKNVPYAIDSSNFKNKYTRNRIRNQIVPIFKELQPDFNSKIIQFQEQLKEASDFIELNTIKLIQEMIILIEKDRIILDLNKLKKVHIALLRNILFYVMDELSKNKFELTYEKIKNLINIINNDKPNVTFNLGKNYYCLKEYEKLIFQFGKDDCKGYSIEIDEFKEYLLPDGMKISVKKVLEKAKITNKSMNLCYNSTILPLIIRTKQEGDYIKTKIGKKKINRIFIDEKIPVSLRRTWPLLVDGEGNILWVIGIQKSNFTELVCDREYLSIEVLN